MEEIKIITNEKPEEVKEIKKPEVIKEAEEKPVDKSMKDMVSEIHTALEDTKKKKIKLPRKARVKKGKLKKGWVGCLIIDENKNMHGEKIKIDGSCFNEKARTYHASDGREIFWFDGKFPVIIQPTWRLNPLCIEKDIETTNQTYGQKYIKARMLADIIKVKTKGGNWIIWIIVIGAAIFGINYFFGV